MASELADEVGFDLVLKGHSFSRAAKVRYFCHHEEAVASEGSAFPTFSAACSAPEGTRSTPSLQVPQLYKILAETQIPGARERSASLLHCRLCRGRCGTRFFRRHVVRGILNPHQPFVEPSDDVIEALHPVPGLPRTRQLMRLAREVHHHRWPVHVFQRTEHLLSTTTWRRPPIHIAEDEHHGCIHVLDVGNRRPLDVVLRIIEGRRLEPVWLEQREVCRVPPRCPVRDIALRDRCV